MELKPWQGDDDGWRLPRSWQEARERWPHDAMLRVVIGFAVVFVATVILMAFRYSR